MSKQEEILIKAKEFILEHFKRSEFKSLMFHNYNHTADVVKAARKIGEAEKLTHIQLSLLEIAAWFHDTGYTSGQKGHEQVSAQFARDFLTQNNLEDKDIQIVEVAILATKYPHKPKSRLEQVLCDADLAHLGSKDYLEKRELLLLENQSLDPTLTNERSIDRDIEFLSRHQYITAYARQEFSKRKLKNLMLLKKKKSEEEDRKLKEEKQKQKQSTPDRGIETMFRVAFNNQMALSAIADNKANIMLSINAIIISISLSTLIPSIESNPNLVIPTSMLLIVGIATIVFATLSTRPKISEGTFSRQDVENHKPNLLFFGNFHGMPIEEFAYGMNEMMLNKDYLYGSLVKDMYYLGKVLAKKYQYLRICYNFFMYGMILTVLTFILTFVFS